MQRTAGATVVRTTVLSAFVTSLALYGLIGLWAAAGLALVTLPPGRLRG